MINGRVKLLSKMSLTTENLKCRDENTSGYVTSIKYQTIDFTLRKCTPQYRIHQTTCSEESDFSSESTPDE